MGWSVRDFLPFKDRLVEKFLHGLCLFDLGTCVEELETSQCKLCQHQFFPQEGCLYMEHGEVVQGAFVGSKDGAVHWACARLNWPFEIMEKFL